jgi:importin-4
VRPQRDCFNRFTASHLIHPQGISCYVLEMFCEHISDDNVAPILDDLVNKLIVLMQSPRLSIKEMAIAAMSAVAIAAAENFAPYANAVMGLLAGPLEMVAAELLTLRGRALECVGHIALGIKKDAFMPYLAMGVRSAEMSIQIEEPELHEFTYAFFANIAKVIEEDFAPYLPALVPHLCQVIVSNDGAEEVILDDKEALAGLNDSDEEGDDDGPFKYMNIRTAVMETKRVAVLALGMMAEHCGGEFCNKDHLKEALPALLGQVDYWNPKIRREVAQACERMVKCVCAGRYGLEYKDWAESAAWSEGASWPAGPQAVPGTGFDQVVDHVNTTVVKVCFAFAARAHVKRLSMHSRTHASLCPFSTPGAAHVYTGRH